MCAYCSMTRLGVLIGQIKLGDLIGPEHVSLSAHVRMARGLLACGEISRPPSVLYKYHKRRITAKNGSSYYERKPAGGTLNEALGLFRYVNN